MNRPFDIDTVCDKCFYNPRSHSFHKLSENAAEIYYYSCPSYAEYYYDADGIYKHMRLEIEILQKPWVWIIDCNNYGLKHLMYPSVGLKIVEFLDSYLSNKLNQIIIINQTMSFKVALKYVWKLIPTNIRKKITFDKNNCFAKLLQIDEKLSLYEESIIYS
jgi:hypothetical protein